MGDVEVSIQRLRPEAALPERMTRHSAGMDLRACVSEPLQIDPGCRMLVPTGIAIALPRGYEAQVRPRSGLARKHGVTLVNAPGTIDEDYRGEIGVLMINHGREPFEVRSGDRIAQLIVAPVARVAWREADDLESTERGDGGFGHTGER